MSTGTQAPLSKGIHLRLELFPGDSTYLDTVPRASPGSELFARRLRIALAMRGGVSLAVWIGGAVSELDILRRLRLRNVDGEATAYLFSLGVEDTPEVVARATDYARLLYLKGYDRVEYDVLAGASAGGMNAVMYSGAQRAGASLESLRKTWLDVGGFSKLLHPPGLSRLNAPLRGDDYFYPEVYKALKRFYAEPGIPRNPLSVPRRIIADLSATVIDGDDSDNPGITSGEGHFHFVGADFLDKLPGEGLLNLVPSADNEYGRAIPRLREPGSDPDPERDRALGRMAYAARSTSSVPAGFEPAVIRSRRSGALATDSGLDFSYAFHAHRQETDSPPYRVVDGGVTDNIPIERALRAVRAISADRPSHRILMYLDPKPPPILRPNSPEAFDDSIPPSPPPTTAVAPQRPPRARADRLSRLIEAAPRAYKHFLWVESGAKEAAAVDAFKRELALGRGRDRGLYAVALGSKMTAGRVRKAYCDYRKAADATLLRRVALDPDIWQLGIVSTTRAAYRAMTTNQVDRFDDLLIAKIDGSPMTRAEVSRGPAGLMDACMALLSWTEALEKHSFTNSSPFPSTYWPVTSGGSLTGSGAVRQRLFEVHLLATRLRDERLALALPAWNLSANPQETVDIWLDPNASAGAPAMPPGLGFDYLWARLAEIVTILRAVSRRKMDEGWGESGSPWVAFPSRWQSADLAAAFVVARGIPESLSDIQYTETTAKEAVASASSFTTLLGHQYLSAIELALRNQSAGRQFQVGSIVDAADLSADGKLTGAALAGFAGFLSEHWRSNDWFWGRLDASSSITRLLIGLKTPDGLPRVDELPDPSIVPNQDQILLQAAKDAPRLFTRRPDEALAGVEPTAWDPARLRERFITGADTLRNLEPSYRVSLATRALHAVVRSLRGWKKPAISAVLVALRPALGVVATLIDPPRFALIAAFLLTGAVFTGVWAQNVQAEPPATFYLAGSLVLVAWVVGVQQRYKRYKSWAVVGGAIDDGASGVTAPVRQLFAEQRDDARGVSLGWTLTAAGVLLMGATLTLVGWIDVLGLIAFGVAAIGIQATATARSDRVRRSNGYRRYDGILYVAALVVFVVPSALATLAIGWIDNTSIWVVPSIAAAVAIAVWLTTSAGSMFGSLLSGHFLKSLMVAGASAIAGFGIALALGCLIEWLQWTSTTSVILTAAAGAFGAGLVQWFGSAWCQRYEPAEKTHRRLLDSDLPAPSAMPPA